MSFLGFLRGKPPEIKVLDLIDKHQSLSLAAADNLQKAFEAKTADNIGVCKSFIVKLNKAEEEADGVRREIMKELASGILSP